MNITTSHPLSLNEQDGVIGGISEIVVALAVAGALMSSYAVLSNKSADDIRIQNTAYQMRQINDATELFIRQNYQALSTVGATQTIPLATLRNGGLLPASFPDNNPFNQTYGIRLADSNGATAGGSLTALIYTIPGANSSTLTPEQAAKTASLTGPQGGYIADNSGNWTSGSGGNCTSAGNCAIGSFGSWRINDLNATFGITPGAGGLASTGFVSEASMAADVLYRTDIGVPLANTMTAPIYGGTAGDVNGDGTINANEVGASRGTGYTLDPTTGTYQFAGQLTVGGFDLDSDGINETFGANTTNNQGVTMTAAGLVDARSRVASPVFDNNGDDVQINAANPNRMVSIFSNAGTQFSAGTTGNSALSISSLNRPAGSNIWFSGGPGDYGDMAFDGGTDKDFTFTHTDPNGTTTFKGGSTGIMRFHNSDASVDIQSGVLRSMVRTASPIFDNNGDSLSIRATNDMSNITIYNTGNSSYNYLATGGSYSANFIGTNKPNSFNSISTADDDSTNEIRTFGKNSGNNIQTLEVNSQNLLRTFADNSFNGLRTMGNNSGNDIQSFGLNSYNGITTNGSNSTNEIRTIAENSSNNIQTFGANSANMIRSLGDNSFINLVADGSGSQVNVFADKGTVFSARTGNVLTILNANGIGGSNIYFGDGSIPGSGLIGDMVYDGGNNGQMVFAHTLVNTGDTIFGRGDGKEILELTNNDASVSVPNGNLFVAGDIRTNGAIMGSQNYITPGGACHGVDAGNGLARIECN